MVVILRMLSGAEKGWDGEGGGGVRRSLFTDLVTQCISYYRTLGVIWHQPIIHHPSIFTLSTRVLIKPVSVAVV